jgi:8-oxo-dGTP pyrophosphatase MutT (NUDIX family)
VHAHGGFFFSRPQTRFHSSSFTRPRRCGIGQAFAVPAAFSQRMPDMATLFNPLDLPVIATDEHLPPIDADRYHADAFRERFVSPPVWAPEKVSERRMTDRTPAHASVLIPIVQRAEPTVLFTQRSDHLTNHPGQISFPGGRAESYDTSPIDTALREAEEEIGLGRDYVDVLGVLPVYTTVTAFIVTPVVALVRPGFTIVADPFEVAEVFEVPLSFLMSPANHHHHQAEAGGITREFLSMPWQVTDAQGQERRYFIWGATAAMLRNLYRFLAA